MVSNGQQWSAMVKDGQQWSTMVRNGQRWSAMVTNTGENNGTVKFQQWPRSQQGLEIVFKYVNNADRWDQHISCPSSILVAFGFKMWTLVS